MFALSETGALEVVIWMLEPKSRSSRRTANVLNQCPMSPAQRPPSNVGRLSVFCEYILLPFVNKEVALAYGKAAQRQVGNPSRDKDEGGQSQGEVVGCFPERKS